MKHKKYLLFGIPILFIIGSIFHYIYELSDNNFIIGLISPVNENIREHLKLVLFPVTLYWLIYSLFNREISIDKWLFSLITSLISSLLTIVCFYYTYTGALGIESLPADIFSLLLGLTVGQLVGLHFYKYGPKLPLLFSKLLLVSLFFIFIFFTLYPPKFPIFMHVGS